MNARLQPRPTRRAMGLHDLDAVAEVVASAYPFPWTRGNFIDSLAAGYLTEVLVDGPSLIGYFVAMPAVDDLHLLNVTVAPAWQGQGHGRGLLHEVMVHAARLHLPRVMLEVRQSNRRAQALYTRLGFAPIGQRRAYYPAALGREDAIVMARAVAGEVSDGLV